MVENRVAMLFTFVDRGVSMPTRGNIEGNHFFANILGQGREVHMLHRGKFGSLMAVGGCLALSGVAIAMWNGAPSFTVSDVYAQQTAAAETAKGELVARAEELSGAFRAVAKAMKPSVVSITATKKVNVNVDGRRGMPEEFRRFFGEDFGGEQFQTPAPQNRRESREYTEQEIPAGLGSGVIISEDGYILTNNHVVAQADGLRVTLSDGRELEVEKVVGTDEKSDLAVLKVNATGLAAAKFGDSEALEVGDWVVAIGSPFGLAQTVTQGIVSATNRADMQITSYDDFIQTDAAINPGNSGGPLLNLQGEVIGINTAIASRSGSYNGIGFAIPSNTTRKVVENLIRNGRMIRGFVGLALAPLDSARLAKANLPSDLRGVVVEEVYPDGPAAKAGLQPGDVIVGVNKKNVDSVPQLRNVIAGMAPGDVSEFRIQRENKAMTIEVKIEEQTDEKLAAMGGANGQLPGLQLEPNSPELAAEYGLPEDASGLVVTGLASNSPFGDLLSLGDLIVSVNGKKVNNAGDVATVLRQSRSLKLEIVNSQGSRMVELRVAR
jgi:serine protease Do